MLFLRGGQPIIIITTTVSKFKLILFVTQQVDKLRDELLGQGTLFGKLLGLYLESQQTKKTVDWYPKKPSNPSQNSGFFYTKGGGVAGC